MPVLEQLHNILIVRTDRIGDVVLTTPVFKALRKAFPLARISVLTSPQTKALVEGNPYIDRVIVDDRQGRHKDLFGLVLLARELRRYKFDSAVILHTKRRYNFACYAAGIPLRIGYKNNKFGSLLTCPLKDERHLGLEHEAQYCLNVVKRLGVEAQGLDVFVPVDKNSEAWALEWMREHELKPDEMIAIHPSASDSTKCWPVANFAALIDRLQDRYLLRVVLIGGPDVKPLCESIKRLTAKPVLDLCGTTTLSQTISILRRCRLLISNDSGPVHVAAGVGINVISLFLRNQPGINPKRWQPLGSKSFVLANKAGEEIQLNQKGEASSGKADSIRVGEVLDLIEHIFRKDSQTSFLW